MHNVASSNRLTLLKEVLELEARHHASWWSWFDVIRKTNLSVGNIPELRSTASGNKYVYCRRPCFSCVYGGEIYDGKNEQEVNERDKQKPRTNAIVQMTGTVSQHRKRYLTEIL
jgi:hypothetical protein